MQRACNGEPSQGPPSPQVCDTVVAALMRFVDKHISMLFTVSIPILKHPVHGVQAISEHGSERAGPDKKMHIPLARALSDQVNEKTTSTTVSLRFLRATANFANSILHSLVCPQNGGP